MIKTSTRVRRTNFCAGALAVGVAIAATAIALPGAALADDRGYVVIEVAQAELTANGDSTSTAISMTLPAGQEMCRGPIVIEGILSPEELRTPNTLRTTIYPKGSDLMGGVGTAAFAHTPQGKALNISGPKQTVSPALGDVDGTALMMCSTKNELDLDTSGGTWYIRHIKNGQGLGGNNVPAATGSVDLFGSLAALSGLGLGAG